MNQQNLLSSEINLHKTGSDTYLLFKETTTQTLDYIRHRNQQNKITFLLSTQPVIAEAAQAAYLFSSYINIVRQNKRELVYKTFFCNSHIEALHGAIKIVRHKASILNSINNGKLLIYDNNYYYKDLFDPLSRGVDKALIPNIYFNTDLSNFIMEIDDSQDGYTGIVICLHEAIPIDFVNNVQQLCKNKNIAFIVDTTHSAIDFCSSIINSLLYSPDIIIWGEELTDYQVPFGAFSVTNEVYKPWQRVENCLIHSTTYGGNGLVTTIVRDYFINNRYFLNNQSTLQKIQEIELKPRSRTEAFCKYVNSIVPLIYKSTNEELDIVRVKGSKLTVLDKRRGELEVIDCVGGAGCNPRGHNPSDVIDEVIERHNNNRDYWRDLSYELCKLAGLEKAFPAVSGACAVDIAITLALLANNKKSKIITFKGNYSGKTLISLNGTWDEAERLPFIPLYWDVIYIDLHSENASQFLLEELNSGNVALVWFEFLQGTELQEISSAILDIIIGNKERLGYFIGVDEIFNGMFRTGNFLSYDNNYLRVDMVTLSKGLSDMTFPIAVTLISDEIYEKAKLYNEHIVARYETLFINQIGSHIALHVLEWATSSNIGNQVRHTERFIRTGLEKVIRQSPLLKGIKGKGLHLQLYLDVTKFPFNVFPFYLFNYDIAKIVISGLCFAQEGVLTSFSRILPPLNINQEDANRLVHAVEEVFKMNRIIIFCIGISQIIKFSYLLIKMQVQYRKSRLLFYSK